MLSAVLAVSLAGGDGPSPPPLTPLWGMQTGGQGGPPTLFSVVVHDERLYLGTVDVSGSRPIGTGSLTAYHLSDGHIEWRVPLQTFQSPSPHLVDGTLVVATGGGIDGPTTSGFNAITGERRWTKPGSPLPGVVPGVVIVRQDTSLPGAEDPFSGSEDLSAVDPVTGRELGGRIRVALGDRMTGVETEEGRKDLFTLERDGTLTRHDLQTGEVVAAVDTPHEEAQPDAAGNDFRTVHDTVVVIAHGVDEPAVVSAYDPVSLGTLWRMTGGIDAAACGSWVCVRMRGDAGGDASIRAVDPVTGDTAWEVPSDAVGGGPPPYVTDLQQHGGVWLGPTSNLAEGEVTGPVSSRELALVGFGSVPLSVMVDAATGKSLSNLADWHLQGWRDDSLLVARGETDESDPLLQGPATTRIWWARANVELAEIRVLGATEAEFCLPHPPYLVCETLGERLTVWGAHI